MERTNITQDVANVRMTSDELPKIVGRGIVFFDERDKDGTQFPLFDDRKHGGRRLVERIHKDAFNGHLRNSDIRSMLNHNPDFLLGRTGAGTMRISKQPGGIDFEIDPPASRSDVIESIRRGDITGASFGFVVGEQRFYESEEPGTDVREIRSFDRITDLSPVAFPAYAATSADVRSADGDVMYRETYKPEVRAAWQEWRQQLEAEKQGETTNEADKAEHERMRQMAEAELTLARIRESGL